MAVDSMLLEKLAKYPFYNTWEPVIDEFAKARLITYKDLGDLQIHVVFSPEACEAKFLGRLGNKIKFKDGHALFEQGFVEELATRTYIYEKGKLLVEYGYITIGPHKNKAIFCFDLTEKKLTVFLLEWIDEDAIASNDYTYKLYRKILENFDYLKTVKNLLVLDDSHFTIPLTKKYYKEFIERDTSLFEGEVLADGRERLHLLGWFYNRELLPRTA